MSEDDILVINGGGVNILPISPLLVKEKGKFWKKIQSL